MKKEEKPHKRYIKEDRDIVVWHIKRVHPKIVVVEVGKKHRPTELTLALKPETYNLLSTIAAMPKKPLPFVFTIDEKGYVLDVIPYEMWEKRKEREDQKKCG